MGGDEFVVLVERGADADTLRRVARAALDAVRRPVGSTDHEVAVSASIGVVRADGGQRRRRADEGGRHHALLGQGRRPQPATRCSTRSATAATSTASRSSARMPEALARGEFGLEYQPLVRLADRAAIGVEALVRWTLPGGGRLDPDAFVPLAEDSGFIVPLGRWVLAQACRHAARLGGRGPGDARR